MSRVCPYTNSEMPCRELQPCYLTPECPFYVGADPTSWRVGDPEYHTHYVAPTPTTAIGPST